MPFYDIIIIYSNKETYKTVRFWPTLYHHNAIRQGHCSGFFSTANKWGKQTTRVVVFKGFLVIVDGRSSVLAYFMPSPAISRRTHSVFGLSMRASVYVIILKFCERDMLPPVGVSLNLQLKCSWDKDELSRFWGPKVKGQGHDKTKCCQKHLFKYAPFRRRHIPVDGSSSKTIISLVHYYYYFWWRKLD